MTFDDIVATILTALFVLLLARAEYARNHKIPAFRFRRHKS